MKFHTNFYRNQQKKICSISAQNSLGFIFSRIASATTKTHFIKFTILKRNHLLFSFFIMEWNTRPAYFIVCFFYFISLLLFFSSHSIYFWGIFFPSMHASNKQKDFLSSLFLSSRAFRYQHPIYLFLGETFFPSTSYHKIIIVIPLISLSFRMLFSFSHTIVARLITRFRNYFPRLHSSTARDKLSFLFCYIVGW